MRKIISINQDWLYTPQFQQDYIQKNFDDSGWDKVCLPHANHELPYNCFDEKEFQFISGYRRRLDIAAELKGKRLFIDFEGVMLAARVFINGQLAGEHRGGYTPFSIEITELVEYGAENTIAVEVDSTERDYIPPFGGVVDYLTFGGIYREVQLRIVEQTYIENIFARPVAVLEDDKQLDISVFVEGSAQFELRAALLDGDNMLADTFISNTASGRNELNLKNLKNIELWDMDNPKLYKLKVFLIQNNREVDCHETNVGFRSAEFRPDGFLLNGHPIKIRGLNRHQAWPYVGYAMPWRAQYRDAEILKYDLGLNLVRTSHYPQSRHFLDRCDEIGLLVFEEIPGWQHIGDHAWQELACQDVRDMIRRDWNHPSVILWGVRINESGDDHDFYTKTNAIAHELDPTRATGGVRCFDKSEFLEDVYTMNDFVHEGGAVILKDPRKVTGLKRDVPYLVTEYNGHMYPTKRFDQQERLAEQALRHLRVINRMGGDQKISGAIGWCAWDYNTHKDFGSGDRICYHGVMDMFRIPKYAAAVYASQQDHTPVLEIASMLAQGEVNAARLLPIEVYTNCDEIRLYRNSKEVGSYYPAHEEYPHVEHPPVIIRDLVGNQLDDQGFSKREVRWIREIISRIMIHGEENLKISQMLKMGWMMLRHKLSYPEAEKLFSQFIVGWGCEEDVFEIAAIKNGEEVVRRGMGAGSPAALSISVDDAELKSGDWDTTRIVCKVVDQYGNTMPFINEVIEFTIEGPAEIIGPKQSATIGGVLGAWIRSTGEPGQIRIKARCSRFESAELTIAVLP